MGHSQVVVRPAGSSDLPVVLSMWSRLRGLSVLPARAGSPRDPDFSLEQLQQLVQRADTRVLVAVLDGETVGTACLTQPPIAPLYDRCAVEVAYLQVLPGARRRGVGTALLAAAAGWADEVGAEHVSVLVEPGSRDANRFFARLGFTPFVVRRVTPTAALLRRMGADTLTGIDSAVAPGRSMRRSKVVAAVARGAGGAGVGPVRRPRPARTPSA